MREAKGVSDSRSDRMRGATPPLPGKAVEKSYRPNREREAVSSVPGMEAGFGDADAAMSTLGLGEERSPVANPTGCRATPVRSAQLMKQGGGDDEQLSSAWGKVGTYYTERDKWAKALQYFKQAKDFKMMAECYYR